MLYRTSLLTTILALVVLLGASSASALEVRINDSRENNFYMDALVWLLDKSGEDYTLVHTDHPTSTQKRKVAFLLDKEIDVIYAGTTQKLEDTLQPVRFPITRGLIGVRLMIINKDYQPVYNQVTSLEQLQNHIAALGYEWAEIDIFSQAGLPFVEKIYDEIFVTLDKGGRFYFPRGALEAFSELKDKQQHMPNLKVEEQLLLKYKSAVLFFVHPDNKALKAALEAGFKKGYADGSYKRFFYNHPLIKSSFDQAKLSQRTVIEIPDAYFPSGSGDIPPLYWHSNQDLTESQ